ncbi:MAG TPA: hypothetical protein VMC83_26230 [Streptosporangiaceae bacterium]|nr:hypothetical protein [Streptosporangiaceae bacterium]
MSVSERDVADLSGGDAEPDARPPQSRPTQLQRWAGPGLFTAACIVAFCCYVRMSSTLSANSDWAANALQAWDMLHGNLLLHGWRLSQVPYYTTELPVYALIEFVHGLNADVVHVAAALTYTMVTALAALLAKERATGAEAWVRMLIASGLMLAPQLGIGTQVLLLPDHVGSTAPVLVAWLLLDRFGRRRWVPAAVGLLLAWALVADAIVVYIGIVPLAVVGLIRAYQEIVQEGRRPSQAWYELSLAGAALAALVVGLKVPALIHALGGYSVRPALQGLAPISEMTTRVWLTAAGLLVLFGGDFFGRRLGLQTGLVLLHLVGVAVAAWAVWAAAKRLLRRSDLTAELLVVGTLVSVGGYLFARQALGIGYSDEMSAALPFAAVLAGRLLAGRLITARLVPVAAAVLLGYLITLGGNALARPAPPEDPRLAVFLARHHLRYGLSGYWQADALTLASGNRVQIRALRVNHGSRSAQGSVSASHWESDASWYNPRLHDANFVLLFAGKPGFSGEAGLAPFDPAGQIQATFGRPEHAYHLGRYTVLVWRQNLLRRLSAAPEGLRKRSG